MAGWWDSVLAMCLLAIVTDSPLAGEASETGRVLLLLGSRMSDAAVVKMNWYAMTRLYLNPALKSSCPRGLSRRRSNGNHDEMIDASNYSEFACKLTRRDFQRVSSFSLRVVLARGKNCFLSPLMKRVVAKFATFLNVVLEIAANKSPRARDSRNCFQ
jgi:hypothetical protein